MLLLQKQGVTQLETIIISNVMKILIKKYVAEWQLLMGVKGSSWINKENQRKVEKLVCFNFLEYFSDRLDQHRTSSQLNFIRKMIKKF